MSHGDISNYHSLVQECLRCQSLSGLWLYWGEYTTYQTTQPAATGAQPVLMYNPLRTRCPYSWSPWS